MKTYQFTLKGYNPENSDTDDLIKWVNASHIVEARGYATKQGWDWIEVEILETTRDNCEVDFVVE